MQGAPYAVMRRRLGRRAREARARDAERPERSGAPRAAPAAAATTAQAQRSDLPRDADKVIGRAAEGPGDEAGQRYTRCRVDICARHS